MARMSEHTGLIRTYQLLITAACTNTSSKMKGCRARAADRCPFVHRHSKSQVTPFMGFPVICPLVSHFCFPNLKLAHQNQFDANLWTDRRKPFPIFEWFSDGDSVNNSMWLTNTVTSQEPPKSAATRMFLQQLILKKIIYPYYWPFVMGI